MIEAFILYKGDDFGFDSEATSATATLLSPFDKIHRLASEHYHRPKYVTFPFKN